ncbi:ASKHA domain-containing protein [Thermodesulfobacteriota bacterium]
MASYEVKFLPNEKTVNVEEGLTLMEAAEKAGVCINNLCGGEGVCGKCRVQITNGKIRADKHSIAFLSKDEIKGGYVLACRTKVETNMEVVIPPESRLEETKILLEGAPVDYSDPEKILVHKIPADPMSFFEPFVQKLCLKLEEPSSEDNISDMDRIIRELRRKTEDRTFEFSLRCLQGLASKLRDNHWKVTITIAKRGELWRILQIESGDTTEQNFGLAVDVGTTTVVVQLVHLKTGKVIGVAGNYNLQAHYGGDVISRMIYACGREGGLDPLHKAVIRNINLLIKKLTDEKEIDPQNITAVAAAGNTTMSHLLLSLIPCSLRLDPYVPTVSVYPQISAKEIGINIHPEAIVETVPGIASYVGGDIVAGVLACGIADRSDIKALIDVGTNGEIAIGNNEWTVCCSASAGPAFEGAGIRDGIRATLGAVERITIQNGEVRLKTIGNAKPRGICGSGLIDCLHELVRNHIIDGEGKFHPSDNHQRIVEKDGMLQYILAYPVETQTGKEIAITQSDISHLIRSKGAVFAAIKSLMDYVGLKFEDIETLYVAGGFGSYLDISKAIGIGLLPDIDLSKIRFIGNSSLMGARMCLLSTHALERAVQIAKSTTNIELSNYQPFMDEYVAAMFLPHTHKRLFPSVDY